MEHGRVQPRQLQGFLCLMGWLEHLAVTVVDLGEPVLCRHPIGPGACSPECWEGASIP